MTNIYPEKNELFTINDLLKAGFDPDRPLLLIDPDTYWWLAPDFNQDDHHIIIGADYTPSRRLDK